MATTKQQYAGASEIDVEKKVVLPGGRSSADADADAVNKVNYDETRSVSDDGLTALPKGTFDPVYEAKARVLNEAVSGSGAWRGGVVSTTPARLADPLRAPR